jgi:hypothetical protein
MRKEERKWFEDLMHGNVILKRERLAEIDNLYRVNKVLLDALKQAHGEVVNCDCPDECYVCDAIKLAEKK